MLTFFMTRRHSLCLGYLDTVSGLGQFDPHIHNFPFSRIEVLEHGVRRLIVYRKVLGLRSHLVGRSNVDSTSLRNHEQ
jgi:hypothetical protein